MLIFRAILFSLLFHAGLVAFLFLRPAAKPQSQVLVVELPLASQNGAAGHEGRGEAKAARRKQAKPSLNNLSPGWSWKGTSQVRAGRPGASGEREAGSLSGKGKEVFSFAQGMDVKAEAKFYPWAERIYKRLDGYLGYPPDFVEESLSGNVTLHFIVDERGRFQGKFLEVEGDEDLLKVYSMAMVVLALREPIFPPSEKKEIPVAVNVQYRLLLPDEFSGKKANFHFKNGFHFDRVGHTDAKVVKQARRLMDKYIPPIIPVPGGFFIDFVALYKKIKERDGNDKYWRRGIRMELDHQELELLVRKATG